MKKTYPTSSFCKGAEHIFTALQGTARGDGGIRLPTANKAGACSKKLSVREPVWICTMLKEKVYVLRKPRLNSIYQGALPWVVQGTHYIVGLGKSVAQETAENSDIRHFCCPLDGTRHFDIELFAWHLLGCIRRQVGVARRE